MAEMTSRERVLTAARRHVPDRVPRSIPLESYVDALLRRYFQTDDLLAALRGDIAWAGPLPTRLETDFSRYFDRPEMTWDEWGRGRIWDAEGQYAAYYYPLERAESAAEIAAYPWPDLDQPYRYAGLAQRVAALHAQGYAVCSGPSETTFEIAWQLRSMDRLFADMHTGDEMAHLLLDRVTDLHAVQARACAEAGVDLIQLGDDVAMQNSLMMSRKMWREWFRPRLVRVVQAAREVREDILIEYHSDGKINDLVPDLIEAGVDILNPVQPECVEQRWIKAEFGERLSFSGGLGVQSVLPFGTPEEVRAHVKEVIQTLGAGGGLIVGPSHVVERDVPLENILAMLAAIDDFGRYG